MLLIRDLEVRQVLNMGDCIEAMERAYRADFGTDIPPKNRRRQ